jgi:excisionase family DNA binding protein
MATLRPFHPSAERDLADALVRVIRDAIAEASAEFLASAPKGPVLSVRETADLLGVSPNTVYRLVSDGVVEAIKVRGSTRITRDSIDGYISGGAALRVSARRRVAAGRAAVEVIAQPVSVGDEGTR